jgi:hypothetical protein
MLAYRNAFGSGKLSSSVVVPKKMKRATDSA